MDSSLDPRQTPAPALQVLPVSTRRRQTWALTPGSPVLLPSGSVFGRRQHAGVRADPVPRV